MVGTAGFALTWARCHRGLTLAALAFAAAVTPSGVAEASASWTGSIGMLPRPPGAVRYAAVAFAPDGRHLYGLDVAGRVDGWVRDAGANTLRRLPAASRCVAVAVPRCATVGSFPTNARQLLVSPDGTSVYVAGDGAILALRRDPTSGALAALSAGGCISLTALTCSGTGASVRIAISPDGASVFAATGDRVLALARDRQTGALEVRPGPTGCVGPGTPLDCASGRGLGWAAGALAVTPDGRGLLAAGGPNAAFSIAVLDVGPGGSLIQRAGAAGLPIDGAVGCDSASGCTPEPALAIAPDGRTVAVGRTDVLTFHRDPGSGALNASCTRSSPCLGLAPPFAFSPDSAQLYATSTSLVDENPLQALRYGVVDPATGRLGAPPPAFAADVFTGLDQGAGALLAAPDGRALVTDALALIGRRTSVPPPSIAVRFQRRCSRGSVLARVIVTRRRPRSPISVVATTISGFVPDQRVRRVGNGRLTVRIEYPGPNDEPAIEVIASGRDGLPLRRVFDVPSCQR